ncbi:hypothetical protein HMI56_002337 [Coelomomyces lativittatus]|nr:hypothetical protein HMI56_002337 [Coelomomyces lativittatus]
MTGQNSSLFSSNESTSVDINVSELLKSIRQNIPKYDGRTSVDTLFQFVSKLDEYFSLVEVPEKIKIAFAASHMTNTANLWYK